MTTADNNQPKHPRSSEQQKQADAKAANKNSMENKSTSENSSTSENKNDTNNHRPKGTEDHDKAGHNNQNHNNQHQNPKDQHPQGSRDGDRAQNHKG